MSDYPNTDPFWVERRAEFLAKKSSAADPSACGTCRSLTETGKPVEHDECAQRATLLHAPDHPDYEILAGFSLEENEQLPARFHIPIFDDLSKPNLWHCAVCWEEGTVVQWPCNAARKYGAQVFSPLHEAETARQKRDAERDETRTRTTKVIEYGVRVPDSAWPEDGVLLDGDTFDRADQEARLERYRDSWPNAELVQRSVQRSAWTEATS